MIGATQYIKKTNGPFKKVEVLKRPEAVGILDGIIKHILLLFNLSWI
jgi:hypothetical protein